MEEKIMSKNGESDKSYYRQGYTLVLCNAWEAKSINGGTPKFSVSLIIPKKDTVTVNKIKAAIEAAYRRGVQAQGQRQGRS
jgi:predicted RNA methylase